MAESPGSTVAERAESSSRVTPSTSTVAVTTRASWVPLRTSVRSVPSSPTRRKRGNAGRTIKGCVASSPLEPEPTRVSAVTARADARQVVVLSGKWRSKLAVPSASVVSWPIQSAVLRKSERTRGAGPTSAAPAAGGAATARSAAPPPESIAKATMSSVSSSAPAPGAPSPGSPIADSSYASLRRSTETASDEAVRTLNGRSCQNASMPLRACSSASESTASSTTATETSADTPHPAASVTVTS